MSVEYLPRQRSAIEQLAWEDAEECAQKVKGTLDSLTDAVSRTVNKFILRKVEVYSFESEREKELYVRALERALNRVLVSCLKSK